MIKKIRIKISEPKIRISKELRERAFKRKAGRMGKRKNAIMEKIVKKEIKQLSD